MRDLPMFVHHKKRFQSVLCLLLLALVGTGLSAPRKTPKSIAPINAPFAMPELHRPQFPEQSFRAVELGANDPLILDIYPHGTSSFILYEDDGLSNDYKHGIYAATEFNVTETEEMLFFAAGAMQGGFNGAPNYRTYRLKLNHIEPIQAVSLDGGTLLKKSSLKNFEQSSAGWFYDEDNRIGWIKFRTRTDVTRTIKVDK